MNFTATDLVCYLYTLQSNTLFLTWISNKSYFFISTQIKCFFHLRFSRHFMPFQVAVWVEVNVPPTAAAEGLNITFQPAYVSILPLNYYLTVLGRALAKYYCDKNECTVPKLRFMYSQKWNCATSFPIPTFIYLQAMEYVDRLQIHECGNWETAHSFIFSMFSPQKRLTNVFFNFMFYKYMTVRVTHLIYICFIKKK
jgi:hypothetical protein